MRQKVSVAQHVGSRGRIDFKEVWENLWRDGMFYIMLVTILVICQSSANCTLKVDEYPDISLIPQ